MKKFTLQLSAFLFFFFIAVVTNAQLGTGKWSFSNPKPFGFLGTAISYADDNNGLIVGDPGGIAKTTDGGATWSYMCYAKMIDGQVVKPTFNDIHFFSTSLAYAVGENGVMIKSMDGGINWTELNTPFSADGSAINTVFFTDANTGYIGGSGDPVTRQSTLYKTTDGGSTWQAEHTFPPPAVEWLEPAICKVRFNAAGVGYLGGASGMIFKYQNGVWSDYSITPTTVFPNVHQTDTIFSTNSEGGIDTVVTTYADNVFGVNTQIYRSLAIVSDSEVVVGVQNNGVLVRINTATPAGSYLLLNNGSSMYGIYDRLGVGPSQIYNLACRDGNHLAGASSTGKVLLSNDKGFTWHKSDVYSEGTPEAEVGFWGVDISPSGRIGLCGAGGVIADSLSQWRRPYTNAVKGVGFGIYSISFADANNGIVAGDGGGMLRTSDGGNSWQDITNPSFNSGYDYYTRVKYISPAVLLAADNHGRFYTSADQGASFDLLFSDAMNGSIAGMDFINQDTGWLTVNINAWDEVNSVSIFHVIIYRTVDGGFSWDSSATQFPITSDYSLYKPLNDIKFFNGNIGYAAGRGGSIYKSIDGGVTWALLSNLPASEADKDISSISIVDENIVFVSGGQGLVMKSVNGGASWQSVNTGLPSNYTGFGKILMLDASQGMVFSNGNVYTTLDGGASWTPYYAPVGDMINDACFVPVQGCTSGLCKKVFAGGSSFSFGFRRWPNPVLKFDADMVLPVKFSKLTGTGTTEGNQLFWTAFSQENVSWFEVERSADGVTFKRTGEKIYPGRLGYQSYQWLDADAAAGKNYYRIKAVENTGASYYTNIVMIASKKAASWAYQLSNGNLILNNAKAQKGYVTATVVNTAGQTIAAKNWNQNGGAFNQIVLLPATAKGIHIVKIDNEGTIASFKILIQ